MAKPIRNIFKNDKFLLSETTKGFYLYDYILCMNLSMNAKTEIDALLQSLNYYQKRLSKVKEEYNTLNNKVESFLCQFPEND